MIDKFTNILKVMLTIGSHRQEFLGASWIPICLQRCPQRYKRKMALFILSESPHYFYKENCPRTNYSLFLEKEFERNDQSRKKIMDQLLRPYLKKDSTVLDYGCGPGFLVKHVSVAVKKIIGVDVSDGVLECAKILNNSSNAVYLNVREIDKKIPCNSIDLIYSFAVVQHVTDAVFDGILKQCFNKLKKGGFIVFHLPLEAAGWKYEEEKKQDTSLYGRLSWEYGLNCFNRSKKQTITILEGNGFKEIKIFDIQGLCEGNFDDICQQQLIVAGKP